MNRFLKGFLVFIAVYISGSILGIMMPGYLGMAISWLSLLGGLVAGLVVAASGGASATTSVRPKTTGLGTATFSWKGVDIYRDQGFLTFHGRRWELSQIHKVSYETSGNRGCMGGTHYTIHIHTKDLNTPRLTFTAGNVTRGGNLEVESNYERLQIAMGFHG